MAKVPLDVLESTDWADGARRLTLFVERRLGRRGTIEDAKEIAQEAIRRFFDPNYAGWDRAKQPDLRLQLGSIANGVMNNWLKRSSRTQEETANMTPAGPLATVPATEPSPEERAADAERVRRTVDLLLERLVGDDLGQKILLLFPEGIEDAAAQAAHLKVPIDAVYKARYRLRQHRQVVESLLDAEVGNAKDATLR